MNIILVSKRIVDTNAVNDVTRSRKSVITRVVIRVVIQVCYAFAKKCYYTCGYTIFMTRRYSLNNSDVI